MSSARAEPIIIVGGGIVGLSLAWGLVKAGRHVTLFEKHNVGSSASGVPYAALWPSAATKRGPGHLAHRASLWKFESFVHELEEWGQQSIEFERLGRIEIPTHADRARALRVEATAATAEWPTFGDGPAQRYLEPDELTSLEPNITSAPFGGLLCQASAYVKTSDLVAALRTALVRKGACVEEETPVADLWIDDDAIRGVITDRPIAASSVIIAAGAWTSSLAPELEATPVLPVKGQQLLLYPTTLPIRHLIKKGKRYLIPTRGGMILVGSTSEPEAGFDANPTAEARDDLFEAAIAMVPALKDAEIAQQWVGHRPQTPAKTPYFGPVPGIRGLYVAAGHHKIGIALAPHIATAANFLIE